MARLVFIGEKFDGRIYEFVVPKTTVGRGDHNTLTIHDASVSDTHCEIYAYGPSVIVRDLGSSNGTFVNGERLNNAQCALKVGQTVKFGSVEARLETDPAPSSDTVTDVTAFHSYGRQLHQPPSQPHTASMTIEAGAHSAQPDHTLMLSRPAEAEKTTVPSPTENQRDPEQPRRKSAIAISLLVIGLVLLTILWLVWGRR